MLISTVSVMGQGRTFKSVSSGDWHTTSIWKVNGTGANPSAADFLDNTNSFEVIATHTVTIGDSIRIKDLTVYGTLTFGRANETFKGAEVEGKFSVKSGGTANVANMNGTRSLKIKGGFENEGTVNFRITTNKSVNVVFDGTQTVSGNETTTFNNFVVARGTVTAGSNLTIAGSFTLDKDAIFVASDKTIKIAGNFTNRNTTKSDFFKQGTSTVVLNGTAVQSVSGNDSNTDYNKFYNLTVSGGGFVVLSSTINIMGDFVVTNNSTVSSSIDQHYYGSFTVDAGSTYDATSGYACYWLGSNLIKTERDSYDQTITLNGTVNYAGISCNSNTVCTKTFYGSINSTAELRAWSKAQIADAGSGYSHTFVGAIVEGGINLQSPMTIKGGTLRKHDKAANGYGHFSLGNGNITTNTGEIYVREGDTLNVLGNLNVETGAFVIKGTASLQAEVFGTGTNTLTVANGARFYLRGGADAFEKDNFPKDFGSVVIGETSNTYYDSKFNQKVHGATYGHLVLDYYNKTFTGDSYIAGHLYMRPMTNGASTVDFGRFLHTLCYHFYDEPDRKGTTSLVSEGTITLKSTGSHGQTIYKRTTGTYTFHNLAIVNDDPTYAQTKTIGGDIEVNGALTMTNSSTNEILQLILDIDNHDITGDQSVGNNFVMGSNTCIKVSGVENFKHLTQSFRGVTIDPNSIVQFDATKDNQVIPGVTYGNIYLYGSTAKTVETTTTVQGWINQNGGTPKLTITDPNVTLKIEGDWKLGASYLDINEDALVSFEGEDQEIVGTTLPNVAIRGSGIKTLKGTLTIQGNLSVYSGSEFNADNRTIHLYGNFSNNSGGGGRFHMDNGRINFRGDHYNSSVVCADTINTRFFNVYIEKTVNDSVKFESDVFVGGNFMTAENRGSIDIANHKLTIGGDFSLCRNCSFVHTAGAILQFNSSSIEQQIRNLNTTNKYPTMRFIGGAVKRLTDNSFDINGDVKIENGAIVTSGVKLFVSGVNWINAGTFNSSSEVEFDRTAADGNGGDQLISGSAFNSVTFGGTGTKRLNGIINLTGWLKIDSLATLDVSPDGLSYYGITVASHWYNNIVSPDGTHTGTFIPRKGTVTFLGNSSEIYSGDSLDANGVGRAGKGFYNVVINTSDPNNYKRLYPIHGDIPEVMTKENDLYVENDFTINTGIFYFYWNKMFVGGNVRNLGGNFSMNAHHDARNVLYLGGASNKTLDFDPGENNTIRQIIINNGARYNLKSSYSQYTSTSGVPRDSIIHIKKGTLWMKDCSITFAESGGIKIDSEGKLHLDSAAVVAMYSGRKLISYGMVELKGDPNSPAKIQSATVDGYYYFLQKAGTFSAEDFCIEGTRGRGLEIRGGSITKLKNGEFSNSGYDWNSTDRTFYNVSVTEQTALLTLDGITLGAGGAGLTADNITFNLRETYPKKNVRRTSGSGAITFTNFGGTMAGSSNELDIMQEGTGEGQGPGLIIWKEPKGCLWTDDGGDHRWHNPANWSGNEVPTKDSVVILNGAKKNTPYTIIIDERAEVKNLTIESGVTVNIQGLNDNKKDGLEVFGKLSMMSGSTLSQANSRDSLILHGSWNCSGTYTHNHVPVVFDMASGSYQLIMHKNAYIGAMILHSRNDGALSLSGTINVVDSVRLEAGKLFANTATIKLQGDWIPKGGTFEMGESVVNFCSTSGEQHIRGGRFWEIRFEGAGAKSITEDIMVSRMVRIMSGVTSINASYNNIYMAGRTTYWYNYTDKDAFVQTGNGSVIFTGGTSYIGHLDGTLVKSKPTVFNNLIIQGSGTKSFRDTAFIKGAFEMVAGVDVSISRYGAIVGRGLNEVTNTSSFTQYGGALLIYGRDNFPKNIPTIELTGGSVYYRDSCLYQKVRDLEYNTLYLYNYYFTTYGYKDYSTKILEGNIAVKGTLYVYDSITTVDVAGKTITLTGNLSMATDGKPIKWGDNGTIIHVGGTWEVDADIDTLNYVYKKGTGYINLNNDLIVKGDIEFDPETRLYMRGNKMTGYPGKLFKMGVNCQLHSAVVKGEHNDVAFPMQFGSYELDPTTTTYLEAAADQILHSGIEYGNLYLNNTASRTVEMDGDITVRGNFYNNQDGTVLNDKGTYNLHLRGATNDLRNYRPTATTVFLEGEGDQRVLAGGSYTELYLNNLILSGSGIKDLDETLIKIGGNITVGANTSFSSDNAIEFGGDAITNSGEFRHYGSTFTFTGKKSHSINMGTNNIFNSFTLVNDDTVFVVGNGISVNTGVFSLGKRAKLDMGSFTHKIASAQIDLGTGSEWITENASFIFNRSGNQSIPALVCRDIQFSTSSTKTLTGELRVRNLTIDEGVTFSVGSDASKSNRVRLTGDWLCSGSFTSHNDTVFFESTAASRNRKINSNGQSFSDVIFHRNTTLDEGDTTYFKLQDKMTLKNNMEIGNGAVLHLNKNTLVIGNDDTNLTDPPYYPAGEGILVKVGGGLHIDGGASLQFNHMDGYPYLNVFGALTMVGSLSENAIITRSSNNYDTHGTKITIHNGARLSAQFYQVQYLAPTGFVIENGAIIDDVNNLSNGIWSNMYTSYGYKNPFQADDNVKVDTFIYLTINVDEMVNPITNIAFNHGGTPTVGHHFNITRDISLPNSITLTGNINGALGFPQYKYHLDRNPDPESSAHSCNIIWPAITQIQWTGAVSQDWFDERNWMPQQLPDESVSVKIPMTSNAPIIYSEGAKCKNLTITKGSLTVENFTKTNNEAPSLLIKGSVDVQDGGVFAIEDTANVKVFGDWSIATKGYFVPQHGTVIFAAEGGSVSIVPRRSDFNNVIFNGGATYMFTGTAINFNGNFIIDKGLVWPSTPDYTYNIGGRYDRNATYGGYNSDITGYVAFVGADQTINNGKFNRVRFSNSGTKLLSGTFDAIYNNSTRTSRTIIVEGSAELKASSGCSLNIKGNVLIENGAKFNDGNQTHIFTGYYWEASSVNSYEGNGKIQFVGNHAQYIVGGRFHDLEMSLSTKYINEDVTMYGDLSMESCTLDMLISHINGTGTFAMGEKSTVYARGENNYPSFANYTIASGTTCNSYYNGPMNQTIRAANYGRLYLSSNTTKTLESHINVMNRLVFNENGGTLNANGFDISVGEHWYNQYNGRFIPGTGRVIFNGSAGTQCAYLGVSVDNPFYEIEIDKPESQQFYASSVDLTLIGSLYVISGKMNCSSGYRVRIGGNVVVGGSGQIVQAGHYELRRSSGTCNIQTNGSILNDLTLNGNCEYLLSDDLMVYGNFVLQKGTFNQNHKVVTLGNSLDNITIYGKYQVTAGGKLRIGDGSSLVVKDGGVFEARGDETSYALITNNGGRYYFTVESGGLIAANHYNFSYLTKQGIIISDGAEIHGTYNFSNGVFSNVVSGGVCLDIRNDQYISGSPENGDGRIENISFPNNPGGGAANIRKVESEYGEIEVFNATGLLAGELYENDPHGIIDWTGDIEYTWTGNSTTNPEDWWDPDNWIAKLNGVLHSSTVPSVDNNVIIPSTVGGSGKYPVITHDSAYAKRLTIGKGARLTIRVGDDEEQPLGCALYATSDVTVEGTLTMTSAIDTLVVGGNWVIGTSGNLTPGSGTIVMTGVGVKTIQNKTMSFNNLIVDNNGTMQAQSAMKVGGDFIIRQGVFDVTSFDVTVGGSFINNATFMSQSRTLYLSGTATSPVDGHLFNSGGSTYYNVTISGGTYNLDGNELFVNRNLDITGGTFNVSANNLNIGDGSGVDNLNITGVLNLQSDSRLKMGNNAIVNVNSGGKISMVGGVNHEAIVTTQNVSGNYAFNVYGTIAARNYKIERINASGLHLFPGSSIDNTYNLSAGQYVSGASGGRYLWFENSFGTDNTDTVKINNVYFNAGPAKNAKRSDVSTNGVISFVDAVGVVASYFFEDEDNDERSPNEGAIVWQYTGEVLQWVGNFDNAEIENSKTRWDVPQNWKNMATNGPATPSATTQLHIYPMEHGKYPIIYGDNGTLVAQAKGITVYSGASLTLKEGRQLRIEDASLGLIIGVNATFTAEDSVFIKGQFSNAGKFDNGGKSTIVWQSSLNRDIEMNGWPFHNFMVKNDGGVTVTFSVEPGKSLVVQNDFTIESGTVDCNGGVLEIGGDFKNENGNFLHGNGTVKMYGASTQELRSENGALVFNNLELTGAGRKELYTSIEVNNITVGATVESKDVDIICRGDWRRPSSSSFQNNFIGGDGKVKFCGTALQTIGKPESFTNLEIDNSVSTPAVSTTHTQTISNDLKLIHGIFNTSNTIVLGEDAQISAYTSTSYINGSVEKVGVSDNVFFPIGGSDRFAPIAISGLTSTGSYRVSYHSERPDNQASLEECVNSISSKEYWTLTRTAGSQMPRVTISWMDRVFSGIEDPDVVSVVLYTNGQWTRQGETDINSDLYLIESDTSKAYLTSHNALSTSGNITFGFTYPTIEWRGDAPGYDYSAMANWNTIKYVPTQTVNILVDEIGTYYPIVGAEGHCYDMTVTSNGILEVAPNTTLTVHGNATIEGTIKLGAGSKIVFLKDVDAVTATVEAATGSTVVIGGKVNQTFGLNSCYNLKIEGGEDAQSKYEKILSDNIEINGSISIDRYTKLTADNKTINLKGNFTINSAGDFGGASSLVMCGDHKQILAITPNKPLWNLTINNSYSAPGESAVDLGTGILVKGHLELTDGILLSGSNARLSLASGATSSSGTTESYVIGEMEKKGKDDFVFPIGTSSRLAQIGISGLTNSAYIIAEYKLSMPANALSLDDGVEKISHKEWWNLRNDGETDAFVTLFWNDSEFSEIGELESLFVCAYANGAWTSFGQNSVESIFDEGNHKGYVKSNNRIEIKGSGTSRSMQRATRRTLNSTPQPLAAPSGLITTLGTTNPIVNPLPIELVSFTAEVATNNDIRLNWSTASEHNNAYFTIEHTFDGVTETVAEVAAQGGDGEGADYSYLHVNQSVGTHYYRLHQTDFDGTTTVASEWVAVVIEDANQPQLMMGIVPNPGKCENIKVSVSGIQGGKFRYVVADMSGQSLIDRTINTAGATSYQIDALDWNLQPSVYLIKAFTDNGQTVSKFVVE